MSFQDYVLETCDYLHRIGGDAKISTSAAARVPDLLIVEAKVAFPDGIGLKIVELVAKTDGGGAHREKYSYCCLDGRQHVFRYEYDPRGHPSIPTHKHLADGRRIPWDRVQLRDVVEGMWDEIEVFRRRLREAG